MIPNRGVRGQAQASRPRQKQTRAGSKPLEWMPALMVASPPSFAVRA
ncbi:MAG: hypothetical protein KGM43_18465 [Planctomycetota bacterium]|nr:hypothetical protein [Planctomycetota bacterium]